MKLLNFLEFGDSTSPKRLIILHGLFGFSRNWKVYGKTFSELGYYVICPDIRNHGASFHDKTMDYQSMVEDVSSLVSRLPPAHTTLLGHSMGGKIAMCAALGQYLDEIDKLIIVDIAPVKYDSEEFYDKLKKVLCGLDLNQVHDKKDIYDYLYQRLNNKGLAQFIMTNIIFGNFTPYWQLNLSDIFNSIGTILDFPLFEKAYEGLTWFIRGENSDYITEEKRAVANHLFPESKFIVIPESGHWPHTDNRYVFLEKMNAILEA